MMIAVFRLQPRCSLMCLLLTFLLATSCGGGSTTTPPPPTKLPPTIAKVFGAAGVNLGSSTSLTFNLSNPNSSVSLSGVGFTDTLPSGLAVSTPNGLSGTCGGGTITATAGGSSISLAGASLSAAASCSFAVNITGSALGAQTTTSRPL